MASDWTKATSRAPSARANAARYRSSSPGGPRQRRWPALQQIGAADDSDQRPNSQDGNALDAPALYEPHDLAERSALGYGNNVLRHSLQSLVDEDAAPRSWPERRTGAEVVKPTQWSTGDVLSRQGAPPPRRDCFARGGSRCDQIIAYVFALAHEPNRTGSRFRQPAHCTTPGHV
jgi:hypothetical protein